MSSPPRLTSSDVCDAEFLAETSMGFAYAVWAGVGVVFLTLGAFAVLVGFGGVQ